MDDKREKGVCSAEVFWYSEHLVGKVVGMCIRARGHDGKHYAHHVSFRLRAAGPRT